MDYTMNGTQPSRRGNRDPQLAPHGVFRCAGEQRWVAIVARTDAEWARLARVMGRADLAEDQRFATLAARKTHEDDLEACITEWTSGRSPAEITAALQAAGIPAFSSYDGKDLAEDPHLHATDFFVRLPHPEVGAMQHVGIPWRMSGTPCTVRRPAPCLGEHTHYVVGEILGYSRDEIERLKAEKVLF
jgi:benzylsuccinate CoA-transferase BbsF subunit